MRDFVGRYGQGSGAALRRRLELEVLGHRERTAIF